jgi:hypothetical protein
VRLLPAWDLKKEPRQVMPVPVLVDDRFARA